MPDLVEEDLGSARAPFQAVQIRADIESLAEQGATEVLLDLNLSPRVGTLEVDAGSALAYAEQVMGLLRARTEPS